MSERVHPRDRDSESPVSRRWTHGQSSSHESGSSSNQSSTETGTYIVQVPKDIVIHTPAPENAQKHRTYTNRRFRKRTCRQCCCASFCLLLLLILLLASASAIFYLIYRPRSPSFSIDSVSIKGVNVTSSASITPAFNVTIRASNPNKNVGFYYEPGSGIAVYHEDVKLGGGELPAFYQEPRNVTVFSTVLVGGEIVVSAGARDKLAEEQKAGRVPLRVSVGLPVKVRVGKLTSWKVTVKVACDVAVSALTALADVISKDCSVDFNPW